MTAMAAEWNNAKLVEHCLRGDERAWNALVDRYKNLVYSIPLKYGASQEDASDIFQAVWLDLFNELPKLRDAAALQAWLVRCTVHKCYHWRRSQPLPPAELEEAENEEAAMVAPRELLAEVEREQLVREAIAQLPPRCRQMVEMLFFEFPPMRYTEVAERLKIAPGSIGFIRGRCLKRLKAILEERGF